MPGRIAGHLQSYPMFRGKSAPWTTRRKKSQGSAKFGKSS
nr:MAG TPA: hypothetical protein [Caudoviricetes sp.]